MIKVILGSGILNSFPSSNLPLSVALLPPPPLLPPYPKMGEKVVEFLHLGKERQEIDWAAVHYVGADKARNMFKLLQLLKVVSWTGGDGCILILILILLWLSLPLLFPSFSLLLGICLSDFVTLFSCWQCSWWLHWLHVLPPTTCRPPPSSG